MEPAVFMPTTFASHVAKHCSHVVNSLDENNNIGGVYKSNCKNFVKHSNCKTVYTLNNIHLCTAGP